MFREHDNADKIYIVRKGEFSMEKKLSTEQHGDNKNAVLELLGSKGVKSNVFSKIMPDINYVPNKAII